MDEFNDSCPSCQEGSDGQRYSHHSEKPFTNWSAG